MVRALPCHGRGRGFKSRLGRMKNKKLIKYILKELNNINIKLNEIESCTAKIELKLDIKDIIENKNNFNS